jgi:hypothetical protein
MEGSHITAIILTAKLLPERLDAAPVRAMARGSER